MGATHPWRAGRAEWLSKSGAGYVIRLGESQDSYLYKRLAECIAFHEGGDTIMRERSK